MNKHSRVCANIDLSAIMHNMEAMHQNIDPNTKIMAVIKADGYGHGAVPIAKEIEHLDYVYGYAAATVPSKEWNPKTDFDSWLYLPGSV